MVLESEHEGYLRKEVKKLGGMSMKLIPMVAGYPDRLIILPGNDITLAELKTTTGNLSPIQRHRHAQLRALGVNVVVLSGTTEIQEWVGSKR